jgi:predicted DNA-binding protein
MAKATKATATRRNFVFRLSESFQQRIKEYLAKTNISLANLIELSIKRVIDKYSCYLTNETGRNALWKHGTETLRIGSSINKELYQQMLKISELTGRSISDLVKEGIWEIINEGGEGNA